MAEQCLDEVNELASWTVTATFTDENGDPVTPIAASVRIDDEKSKTEIRGRTNYVPSSSSFDIEIDSNENRILNDRHSSEIRIVTLEWDYNSTPGPKHGVGVYRYRLINTYGAGLGQSPSQSPSHSASPSHSNSSSVSPSSSASPST